MKTLAAATCVALLASTADAALIGLGDPTTELEGSLFIDDASTGDGDTAILSPPGSFNPQRTFDLNGLAGAPGVAGTVTIQGFGFATNASDTQNTATAVTLTFTYLGANEAFGGGDDVEIGSETVDWNNGTDPGGWDGAGTYFVNLDTEPSAFIDGLGERFRITIAPVDGSIRFKQSAAANGIKLSVSGTFVAIPEPAAMVTMLLSAALFAGSGRRLR